MPHHEAKKKKLKTDFPQMVQQTNEQNAGIVSAFLKNTHVLFARYQYACVCFNFTMCQSQMQRKSIII